MTQIIEYGYLRKSTDKEDKQILSLPSQKVELSELASRVNTKIGIFLEESKSAKMPGRPIFNQMIEDIKKSKIPARIFAWHPNRLTRNNTDMAELIGLMEQGKILEIVTQQCTYRNTPNDKFFFAFWCLQSKLDNDNKSVDITRGMKTRALTGYYPGRAPLGYTEDKSVKITDRKKIPNADFSLYKKAIYLILNRTYTPAKMLDIINEEWQLRSKGGKKIAKNTFYNKFLHNPFIYGEYQWGGVWIVGSHEPMITKIEWIELQEIISGNRQNKIKPQEKEFIFGNGMLKCGECENPIISYDIVKKQKNGVVRNYVYNECKFDKNCSQKCTESKIIDKQVQEYLNLIEVPKEIHDLAMTWIKTENENKGKEHKAMLDNFNKRYQHLLTTIDGLIDMRASKLISEEQYLHKVKNLERERDELKTKIDKLHKDSSEWLERAGKMFTFAEYALKMYDKNDININRQILRAFGSNLLLKEKNLEVTRDSWIYPMQEIVKETKRIKEEFKPLNTNNDKDILENLSPSTTWCSQ